MKSVQPTARRRPPHRARGLTCAAKAGLNIQQVYDIIKVSAGHSRIFELRAQQMIDGRFDTQSGQLGIFTKDLGIVADTATQMNMPSSSPPSARQMIHAGVAVGAGHRRRRRPRPRLRATGEHESNE
ncbi:MAG: NAD-binding protein [Chloroflexia bacterium]